MKIIIDLRPLIGPKTSGVKTYIRQLLQHLLKIDTRNKYILWVNSFKDQSSIFSDFRAPNIQIVHTHIPNKLLNLCLGLLKKPYINRLLKIDADLFFMPDFRPFSISPGIKSVCTLHDLSFEHFPEYFSKKTKFWHKFINPRNILDRCSSVIAVSAFTKNDLIETYKIPDKKIHVIHEGHPDWSLSNPDKETASRIKNKYHLPDKYFLCLSALEPRKNLERLIRAFLKFKKSGNKNIKLVIAGETDPQIFAKINLSKSADIIITGYIQEEDKAYLYRLSYAFIYPSLFEGFGLPLLEAISLHVPVITSNTSVMPEICGKAAVYFDPQNETSMLDAMQKITIESERKQVIASCKQTSQKFTWVKCATKTLQLFESLCP